MTFVVVFVLGGFLTKGDRKKIFKNANYFFSCSSISCIVS